MTTSDLDVPRMTIDTCPRRLATGATSIVYQLNDSVVVKIARKGADEEIEHAHEQKILELLEQQPFIPYLIRLIHQERQYTFLELAPNGSLAMLLNKNQMRNTAVISQVLSVSQTLPQEGIRRWMSQLCRAAAGLEEVGLAPGDIRPGNILFDAAWNVALSDHGRTVKIDDDLEAVSEPFGWLLSKEDGEGAGTYGKAGARAVNLAIGSVFYALLRGHDPYEKEYWGQNHYIIMSDKFQNKEFPPLTPSPEDEIIRKCWYGEFKTVKELAGMFMDSSEIDSSGMYDALKGQWYKACKAECQQIAKSGKLEELE